ncbi:MAG: DUF84 family protein [Nanoarchaeota archaeon]|nr:DUF84 family protein [Nanoarchaeota archaeon]
MVLEKKGDIGLGRAESLMLPEAFARRIRQGEELGKIADEMTGIENIKKKQGAVGYFTADILSREEVFVHATIMAMARFARQEMYT